jgi:hypothetical protein
VEDEATRIHIHPERKQDNTDKKKGK